MKDQQLIAFWRARDPGFAVRCEGDNVEAMRKARLAFKALGALKKKNSARSSDSAAQSTTEGLSAYPRFDARIVCSLSNLPEPVSLGR